MKKKTVTAAKSNELNFKIERIKVEAKSHKLSCKCKKEVGGTFMIGYYDHPNRIGIRCDECHAGEPRFSFGPPTVERYYNPDALEEITRDLIKEVEKEKPEPGSVYATETYEEKYQRLLREAIEEEKK